MHEFIIFQIGFTLKKEVKDKFIIKRRKMLIKKRLDVAIILRCLQLKHLIVNIDNFWLFASFFLNFLLNFWWLHSLAVNNNKWLNREVRSFIMTITSQAIAVHCGLNRISLFEMRYGSQGKSSGDCCLLRFVVSWPKNS